MTDTDRHRHHTRHPAVPPTGSDGDTVPVHLGRGLTPRQVAAYLRVSPDRVRSMIQAGELGAVNTAPRRCGKPRYVILPHHLAEFERGHRAAPPPRPPRRRRRVAAIDYFPD